MLFVESENYLQDFEKMTQEIEYNDYVKDENNYLNVWSSMNQLFYGIYFLIQITGIKGTSLLKDI